MSMTGFVGSPAVGFSFYDFANGQTFSKIRAEIFAQELLSDLYYVRVQVKRGQEFFHLVC
jgi:hypothetical protein